MSTWVFWRIVKLVSFALFAGGLLGVVQMPERRRRLRAVYLLAIPGFVGTWCAGWMLMKEQGWQLLTPWIAASMALSVSALHTAFLSAHLPSPRAITPALTLGSLFATLLIMVVRSDQLTIIAALAGAGLILGGFVSHVLWQGGIDERSYEGHRTAERAFRTLARFEGLSLLLMVAVSMPLRMFNIDLDGESNLIAWSHGVLVIAYVQALFGAASLLEWSWRTRALALVAALLPAGTFVFERWLNRRV